MWDCQFSPPSMQAWAYAVIVHGTCSIIGAIPLGTLLFFVIRSTPSTSTSPHFHQITGVIVGSIASLSVPIAQSYIEFFAPNENIRWVGPFLASTFGFSTFFKSINAGFHQFPQGAQSDLATWLAWFVNLPEPEFAKGKMRRADSAFVWIKVRFSVCKIVTLFVLLTVLKMIYEATEHPLLSKSLAAAHILGFLYIWLIYLYASSFLDFSSLANIVTTGRMRTEPGFQNPLLQSRSFKEAWGVRWNAPVQILLKRTVYVPARKCGLGRGAAAILTFLTSGLLHEYNFSIHNRRSYEPGKATVFFMLMGLVMLSENWVWERLVPRCLQRVATGYLPTAVVSVFLTLVVSGLFEHYFIQSWIESGFLDAAGEMFPHLSCKRQV